MRPLQGKILARVPDARTDRTGRARRHGLRRLRDEGSHGEADPDS